MNIMYTLMHYEFMINTCEAIEEESNGLVVFRSNEVAITKEWWIALLKGEGGDHIKWHGTHSKRGQGHDKEGQGHLPNHFTPNWDTFHPLLPNYTVSDQYMAMLQMQKRRNQRGGRGGGRRKKKVIWPPRVKVLEVARFWLTKVALVFLIGLVCRFGWACCLCGSTGLIFLGFLVVLRWSCCWVW